jgi:hypothetical protein
MIHYVSNQEDCADAIKLADKNDIIVFDETNQGCGMSYMAIKFAEYFNEQMRCKKW